MSWGSKTSSNTRPSCLLLGLILRKISELEIRYMCINTFIQNKLGDGFWTETDEIL